MQATQPRRRGIGGHSRCSLWPSFVRKVNVPRLARANPSKIELSLFAFGTAFATTLDSRFLVPGAQDVGRRPRTQGTRKDSIAFEHILLQGLSPYSKSAAALLTS
jgi:hypothetical protein